MLVVGEIVYPGPVYMVKAPPLVGERGAVVHSGTFYVDGIEVGDWIGFGRVDTETLRTVVGERAEVVIHSTTVQLMLKVGAD